MTGTATTEAAEFANTYNLQVVPIPTNRAAASASTSPTSSTRPRTPSSTPSSTTSSSATRPGQPVLVGTDLGREVRAARPRCSRSGACPTRCSTPSSTSARPRSSPRPAGSTPSPSPPTWPAAASTSSSAATPRAWPSATLAAEGLDPETEEGEARYDELLEPSTSDECKAEGDKVRELGGLYVLGTERHESPPHRQPAAGPLRPPGRPRREPLLPVARGRAHAPVRHRRHELGDGQGPPRRRAASRRRWSPRPSRRRRTPSRQRNAEIRKNVLKYDEVMNEQRKVIYRRRNQILEGARPARPRRIEELAEAVETVIGTYCVSRVQRGVGPRRPRRRDRARSGRPSSPPSELTECSSTDELYDAAHGRGRRPLRAAREGARRDGHARGRAPGDAADHRPEVARAPRGDGLPPGGHQPPGHGPEGPAHRVAARGLRHVRGDDGRRRPGLRPLRDAGPGQRRRSRRAGRRPRTDDAADGATTLPRRALRPTRPSIARRARRRARAAGAEPQLLGARRGRRRRRHVRGGAGLGGRRGRRHGAADRARGAGRTCRS